MSDEISTGRITVPHKFEQRYFRKGQRIRNQTGTHELVIREDGHYFVIYTDDGIVMSRQPEKAPPFMDLGEYDFE